MNNSIYQQTMHNLKVLRFYQMQLHQLHLESIAAKVSTEKLSFTEGLLKLTNYEVDFKENSAAQNMVHAAAFPFIKTLADFDFSFQPSVSETQYAGVLFFRLHGKNGKSGEYCIFRLQRSR